MMVLCEQVCVCVFKVFAAAIRHVRFLLIKEAEQEIEMLEGGSHSL